MRSILIVLSLATALILTLVGCNSTGCTENQNSLPLAKFYSSSTKALISVDSINIGGVGAPNDSLLNPRGGSINLIYLPLRSTASTTSFYFRYTQRQLLEAGIEDTITFDYDSEPYFVSEDCGAMYYYRLRKVTHTHYLIDSVGIIDSLITNVDAERIQIYFRTSTEPQEGAEEYGY